MAQPVFDGHPLEDYLRDSGEASELMPGGIHEFLLQSYLTHHPLPSEHTETMEKLCFIIFGAFEFLSSLFSSDRTALRTRAFAERFKYGVISSSLLSPAYAATPMHESHRRIMSQSLPGKLVSGGHSRTSSLAASLAESTATDVLSLSMPQEPESPFWPITLSFTVAVAALSARFYFLALLLLAGTLYYMHVHRLDIHSKPDVMTPSLQALQNLISAGQLWDSVINDTFSILENEERNTLYGPKSPPTPSSSLRVGLSTSLLTTQTQCDNVRQLLAAITSPSELSQLTEMYAPPSPMKSSFSLGGTSPRPLSHPGSGRRESSLSDRMRKRSTWNGSYAALALAGSPPAYQMAQRREKRRSDLSALLGTTPSTPSPSPIRKSPRTASTSPPQPLADVSEEEDGMLTVESSFADGDGDDTFGAAALGLYRKRVSGGLGTFEASQRYGPTSPYGSSTKRRTTMSPGSKYTCMTPTRHPLSLSSLNLSLQSALGSKRFACSYLLALRFEDDDDVYWEDVRAVMSLLTSTLVDASARLSEVLDEVEEQHLKADDSASESASVSASGLYTPCSLPSPPPSSRPSLPLSHTITQIVSFAPTPTHLSRFAAHVDAISTALDDARDQLAQCVASLKEDEMHSPAHSSHPSTSSSAGGVGEASEHPAVRAYERLRRELGLALRECERGRERLVNIVAPPTPTTDDEVSPADSKPFQHSELPSSGVPSRTAVVHPEEGEISLTVVSPSGDALPLPETETETTPGDVSADLLLSTSVKDLDLPPPGVEQVYEADAGLVGAFSRERSTLSREERIRLVKERRERAKANALTGGLSLDPPAHALSNPHMHAHAEHDPLSPVDPPTNKLERWGPGTDVVQELKDVIWKVSERKRKMTMTESGLVRRVVGGATMLGVDVGVGAVDLSAGSAS